MKQSIYPYSVWVLVPSDWKMMNIKKWAATLGVAGLMGVGLVLSAPMTASAHDFDTCGDGTTYLPKSTNLNAQGWAAMDGNNNPVTLEYTADGLRFNSPGDVYIYKALPAATPLAMLEPVSFNSTLNYGGLIFYSNDNATNAHWEPLYTDAPLWTNRTGVLPAHAGGGTYGGTFADLLSNPSAENVAFWINGGHDTTLRSITFGCTTQRFGLADPPAFAGFEAATGVERVTHVNGWLLAVEVGLLALGGALIARFGVEAAKGRN